MASFALAVQGGGSRGLYSAKILDALMKEGLWADEVIATSCGGLMAANYVSKDIGRAEKMAFAMADDKQYFNPFAIFSKRKTMFDYDHLVYDMSKLIPFSFDVFAKNPCKFYVVSSSCLDGSTAYLEKSLPDFMPNGLAASAALPLTSHPIEVGGVPYLDGGVTCPIGFEKAFADGYSKVVVIATRAKGYRKGHLTAMQKRLVHRMYSAYPNWLHIYDESNEIYNAEMDAMDLLEQAGKLFVIYPSIPPNVSHSERNKEKLKELMDMGEKDVGAKLSLLKEYLSK